MSTQVNQEGKAPAGTVAEARPEQHDPAVLARVTGALLRKPAGSAGNVSAACPAVARGAQGDQRAGAGGKKASAKKAAANRRNAARSTGPRTEAGKARVAGNAIKHGLRSDKAVVPGERREEYEQFVEGMVGQFAPRGPVERFLAERAAHSAWRMRRAERYERDLAVNVRHYVEKEYDYRTIPAGERTSVLLNRDSLPVLIRYESQAARLFYKAMAELKKRKESNAGIPARDPGEEATPNVELPAPDTEGQEGGETEISNGQHPMSNVQGGGEGEVAGGREEAAGGEAASSAEDSNAGIPARDGEEATPNTQRPTPNVQGPEGGEETANGECPTSNVEREDGERETEISNSQHPISNVQGGGEEEGNTEAQRDRGREDEEAHESACQPPSGVEDLAVPEGRETVASSQGPEGAAEASAKSAEQSQRGRKRKAKQRRRPAKVMRRKRRGGRRAKAPNKATARRERDAPATQGRGLEQEGQGACGGATAGVKLPPYVERPPIARASLGDILMVSRPVVDDDRPLAEVMHEMRKKMMRRV